MNLCKYSDMVGKPNTSVHKYRFLNIAIVDVIATIIVAYIIYYICYYMNIKTSFSYILIILFLLGILMHYIFCVKTTINQFLFS